MRFVLLALAALAMGSVLYASEIWPQFRGPDANGYSDAKKPSARGECRQRCRLENADPRSRKDQFWLSTATAKGKSDL